MDEVLCKNGCTIISDGKPAPEAVAKKLKKKIGKENFEMLEDLKSKVYDANYNQSTIEDLEDGLRDIVSALKGNASD